MALVLCYIRDTVSAFAWQYCKISQVIALMRTRVDTSPF